MNGGACLQAQKNIQQGETVLAAGHADHDFVSVFDQVEISDSLADLTVKTFDQLVVFEAGFVKLSAGCHLPE